MIWIKQGSILNWNIYRGDIMLDDFIKVMVTNPSEVVSIDLKEFQKKEPVAYAELLEDYPKVTKRSESLRITIK